MLIIPAIDLQSGGAVRLLRGAFDAATQYGDPDEALDRFVTAGAAWVHIVDLDGAKAGEPCQHDLIARLAQTGGVRIQSGGGVRTRAHVEALLAAGVSRVVVGSVAARRPLEVRDWLAEFGADRVCVALDVRRRAGGWEVAADGWTSAGAAKLEAALDAFPPGVLRHALVTDISRDGALSGSNVSLMTELVSMRSDIAFQASGGVATLSDITAQREAGAAALIVGRALYEQRFTLEDALAL
ncbi:1-(5-phosphoribosyl)-5-[(5-phosphoribosylamino)methylideneamino] imidazole-4-carboxamide isomerase [Terricaulis sp.]|uniref:1-(5-phosphoribosyl)-5-[(5- phosphoribosylamino)methylideneamino] imidazole-4-carboxamide isomerase n=1 Tax=Terricaulis sp. TaxID=2768686 RepID=UPI003784FE82